MQPSTPPLAPSAPKTSGWAIASLIFAFLCFPVGGILAIVALVKLGRDPQLRGKGLAIAGLVISGLWLFCLPIQAAVAIPNFMRFQARAKQAECKTYLKSAYTSQRSLHLEHERYASSPEALFFRLEPGARYVYLFGSSEAEALVGTAAQVSHGQALAMAQTAGVEPGVTGECPECEAVMVCVGNLDGDAHLDVWSISTGLRTLPDGTTVFPGEPFLHSDDVKDE